MPQTKAGRKVQRQLEHQYGDKAQSIYYALQVEGKGGKGKHRWEQPKPGGKLAKARRTYTNEHKKNKKANFEKIRKEYFGLK